MFQLVLLALAGRAHGAAEAMACHKAAARLASALAARHGAGFAALHVSGPPSQEVGSVSQPPAGEALARRRRDMEALFREVMPPGLTVDVMAGAGVVHLEVLESARSLGPDLLVLGGQDATEACRREFSAAQPRAALLVAQGARCPVLVAAQASAALHGPFERLLVCVDLCADETTQRLLAFAARLAAREGAELFVLHALPLSAEPPGEPLPSQEDRPQRIAQARDRLGSLCQGLPGADRFTVSVCEGPAHEEILKYARERKADLILLAPSPADQGGVAERVLTGARCPVLLLGPGACPANTPKTSILQKG